MQKDLLFRSIDGDEILKFEHFKLTYDDDFKRVVFKLSIDFEFFKAETILDAEEFDFFNMKENLEKIYKKEWNSFIFIPIDEQIKIQFDLLENEKIKIRVKLCNKMFTCKLEFEFFINLTSVPDLINEIECIFENDA